MNHIHISVNGKTIVDETQNDSWNLNNNSISLSSTQKIVKKQKKSNKNKDIDYYCGLFGDIHPINKNSLFYRCICVFYFLMIIVAVLFIIPYIFLFVLFLVALVFAPFI
jgi:hypothetical protein